VQDQLSLGWGGRLTLLLLTVQPAERKKRLKSCAMMIHDLIHFNLEHLILVYLKEIFVKLCVK